MLNKKLYSTVVALSVGMSGCYGYQGRVLQDTDSVLSMPLSNDVFERGFKDFYTAPTDSLEQRVLPFGVIGSGPCPPYLPNCGKKKEEKKDPTEEEDEVFRGGNPPQRNESSGSSNSASENSSAVSKKGCGQTCITAGYITSGVGLLLLGSVLMSPKTYSTSIKSDNYSNSEGVTIAGGIALFTGLGLVIYGHATK